MTLTLTPPMILHTRPTVTLFYCRHDPNPSNDPTHQAHCHPVLQSVRPLGYSPILPRNTASRKAPVMAALQVRNTVAAEMLPLCSSSTEASVFSRKSLFTLVIFKNKQTRTETESKLT